MKPTQKAFLSTLAVALILAVTQRAAYADITGSITLDTSGLSGPFELAFIFIDGSGIGDANNTVTLNNFTFGAGGSAGSVDALLTTGGASGDISSSVSLLDSAFFNIFASTFNPGDLLSFDFALTTAFDLGGTPDQFSMALLQVDGPVINTADPSGANALLSVNLDSTNPTLNVFTSDLTPAAIVSRPASLPEPSSAFLVAIALAVAFRAARRRAILGG